MTIDGSVFENDQQLGIWRMFHEVITRTTEQVNYTLWLRSQPVRPIPEGVKIIRDAGRRYRPRWDLPSYLRRSIADRFPSRSVRRADIFHSSYFTLPPSAQTPSVVSVYDMIAEQAYSNSGGVGWESNLCAKREAILSARVCVAISHATADDLKRFYPEVSERIRVVPLGTDHLSPQTTQRPSAAEPGFALFVGHRHGYKNFPLVLDAMQTPVWPKGLALHVVGSPLTWYDEQLIQAVGLKGKVHGLGRLSDEQLKAEYAAARCFIFPSQLEGFGLPVLEAQINGCPAVVSDIAVFREVAGEAARFFDPRLGERLADAVAAVCEPDIRRTLIEAGYANVERYRWDQTAEGMLAVYAELT